MTAYDETPYPSLVHAQTHPDRLATHALLRGLDPPPPETCRVLELGCYDGINLISMALASPGIEAVGVDLASQPVARGNEIAAEVGVGNVRLLTGDAGRADPAWGTFDYVIAHGVYSWVPEPVRDGLLETIRSALRPNGIGYVSYSAYPGAHTRRMFREMMLLYAGAAKDVKERTGRAVELLRALGAARPADDDPWNVWLRSEIDERLSWPRDFLRHDDLAEVNEPCWFHEFVRRAASHGLRWLGEADWMENVDSGFPEGLRTALASIPDPIAREQTRDLLKFRRFRQSLLVHPSVEPSAVRPEGLARLFVSANVALDPAAPPLDRREVESFTGVGTAAARTDARGARAAVRLLASRWPRRTAFPALVDEALAAVAAACGGTCPADENAETVTEILLALHDAGLVRLHATAPRYAGVAGPRPRATPLARWLAQRGDNIVSLTQLTIQLADPLSRRLVPLLDGTRDRGRILAELLRQAPAAGGSPPAPTPTPEGLESALQRLAAQAVLLD